MVTSGSSSMGLFSNIMTVSWFEVISFLQLSWNITKNLSLPDNHCTTPVNYFLNRLENNPLTFSFNSPTLALTTIPTTILSPLPLYLHCVWGGRLITSNKNRGVNVDLIVLQLGGFSDRLERLDAFSGFFSKKNSKPQKQDCTQTYIFLTIGNSVFQLA